MFKRLISIDAQQKNDYPPCGEIVVEMKNLILAIWCIFFAQGSLASCPTDLAVLISEEASIFRAEETYHSDGFQIYSDFIGALNRLGLQNKTPAEKKQLVEAFLGEHGEKWLIDIAAFSKKQDLNLKVDTQSLTLWILPEEKTVLGRFVAELKKIEPEFELVFDLKLFTQEFTSAGIELNQNPSQSRYQLSLLNLVGLKKNALTKKLDISATDVFQLSGIAGKVILDNEQFVKHYVGHRNWILHVNGNDPTQAHDIRLGVNEFLLLTTKRFLNSIAHILEKTNFAKSGVPKEIFEDVENLEKSILYQNTVLQDLDSTLTLVKGLAGSPYRLQNPVVTRSDWAILLNSRVGGVSPGTEEANLGVALFSPRSDSKTKRLAVGLTFPNKKLKLSFFIADPVLIKKAEDLFIEIENTPPEKLSESKVLVEMANLILGDQMAKEVAFMLLEAKRRTDLIKKILPDLKTLYLGLSDPKATTGWGQNFIRFNILERLMNQIRDLEKSPDLNSPIELSGIGPIKSN